MNKNILFLINGFGIQQSDCFDIFNQDFMKTLTGDVSKYLYSTIKTKSFEYKDGYSELSTGSNTSISYTYIDKIIDQDKIKENEVLKEIAEKGKAHKIQVFCTLEDINTFYHLKKYLEFINDITNNVAVLNLILTPKDFSQFKQISEVVNKISLELSPYATIGYVIGANNLNGRETRDYIRIFYTGVAEIWHDTNRKFETLANAETRPSDTKPFMVNKDFMFNDGDIIFFFNHEDLKIDFFLNECEFNPISRTQNKFEFYSLFPINTKVKSIKSMYPLPTSDISLASALKQINQKALILCNSDEVDNINYYCNGYSKMPSDNVCFGILDKTNEFNPETLKLFVANPEFKLVIVNYSIDSANTVEELRNRLNKIDEMLKVVQDISLSNGYTLTISSLYGLNKKLIDAEGIYRTINFSTKVPVILVDLKYPKDKYSLSEGEIYTITSTIYKNLFPEYKGNTLFMKKSSLSSLVGKKG